MLEKLSQGVTLVVDRYVYSGIAYSAAKEVDTMTLEVGAVLPCCACAACAAHGEPCAVPCCALRCAVPVLCAAVLCTVLFLLCLAV